MAGEKGENYVQRWMAEKMKKWQRKVCIEKVKDRRRITEDDWQESDWLKNEQRNLHIEDEWREGKKLMIDYAKESMYKGNDQREKIICKQ